MTDDQMKELLEEHFTYEVDMLCFAFDKFIDLKKHAPNRSGYAPSQDDKTFVNRTDYVEFGTTTIVRTVLGLPQYSAKTIDKNLKDAMLETLLLHARNLVEFFYKDEKSIKTDALALEFFGSRSDWIGLRPKITDSLKEIRRRAGKELAHLTYKRIARNSPQKDWNTKKIMDDLLKVVYTYLREVPSKYKGEEIRALPERIKAYPNLPK